MRIITLHRPWAYAVACLGKDIENRSWKCYLPTNTRIGIHAGKRWDQDGADWIESLGLHLPPEQEHKTGIICTARFDGNVSYSPSKWFVGEWGWKLSDVRILQAPIQCLGKQGLWEFPRDLDVD